ncbi:hypothetical protein GUITHDRAFT_149927, partial [Guillardia theta CCMP2712]|mmetsp:Transcript_4519/g.16517  ORF Transcript_4519/g.16517 Transcript_4519/m.16517 type:complete len:93 (-) Transcript_4519:112-390(-)
MSVEGLKEVKLPAGVTAKDILHTAPYNAYNPQQNQTKHCYAKYNEFFRCAGVHGEDAKECKKIKHHFISLCPVEWIEKWNDQREAGTFPGPL